MSIAHQLDEHAARAARVQERHPVSARAGAGHGVNERDACLAQALQGGLQVGYAVRQVMQAWAATREEAGHGAIGCGRLDELEPTSSLSDERDIDLLRRDMLHRGCAATHQRLEDRGRGGDGFHSNTDVIERELHVLAPASFLQSGDPEY
jgi:hypothetical protein